MAHVYSLPFNCINYLATLYHLLLVPLSLFPVSLIPRHSVALLFSPSLSLSAPLYTPESSAICAFLITLLHFAHYCRVQVTCTVTCLAFFLFFPRNTWTSGLVTLSHICLTHLSPTFLPLFLPSSLSSFSLSNHWLKGLVVLLIDSLSLTQILWKSWEKKSHWEKEMRVYSSYTSSSSFFFSHSHTLERHSAFKFENMCTPREIVKRCVHFEKKWNRRKDLSSHFFHPFFFSLSLHAGIC